MSVTVTIGEDVYRDVMGIRGEFEDFEDVIVRLLDGEFQRNAQSAGEEDSETDSFRDRRFEIVCEFVSLIDSDDISKIILYGSVSRGEDREDSDIDILIVFTCDNPDLESKIDSLVCDFLLETGELISPYIMSEEYFNKTREFSFLQSVLADGIFLK